MNLFRRPSLLDTLGAAFLPLYWALLRENTGRVRALIGLSLCVAIILLTNSGDPVSMAGMAVAGWMLWTVRARMPLVRRGLPFTLVFPAIIFMKAPIWYLPAKVSSFSGSDGWHRSYLMDVSFREFDKWWLVGVDMDATKDWFDYRLAATGSADITNQYLFFGLTSGILSTILLTVLIVRAFQHVGLLLGAWRDSPAHDGDQYLVWGLGCCIGVHVATWLGITYNFDQTFMIWSMQLAAISSLAASALAVDGKAAAEMKNFDDVLEKSW